MEFSVCSNNFELAGKASMEIKKALEQKNFNSEIIRRAAIACYELEINLTAHSDGGCIGCCIQPDGVIITASDTGPGIADLNLALREGFSTASDRIRSLGFGAGMGFANIKRVSDEFSIDSAMGKGTTVRAVMHVDSVKNS